MSFGHSLVSGKRDVPVHYVMGTRPAPKQWYKKHVGWFGHMIAVFLFTLFGMFSMQVRDLMLQAAGSQLSSLSPADLHPAGQKPQQLLAQQTPPAATNIVEVQPLVASWAKAHGPMQWGIVMKSIGGPQIDASVQPNAAFESRALYKLFVATAVYNQTPAEKYGAVKVGNRNVLINTCVEKMLRDNDAACTDALAGYVDKSQAADFFKKAGVTRTTLSPATRSAKTTAGDAANLFASVNGSLLTDKSTKQLLKYLAEEPAGQQLTVACPGCTTMGVADYGIGRLEAAGIVTYSKGSYLFVMYANGGTKDLVTQLSGKLQQRIVETTTNAFKP